MLSESHFLSYDICYQFCTACTNFPIYKFNLVIAGLSNIQGLSISSNPKSPIVFLNLEKSTGSTKDDLKLLEAMADRVRNEWVIWFHFNYSLVVLSCSYYVSPPFWIFQALKEDSVFVVTTKRSTLDKCRLPVGIRLFVSAAHSDSDLLKACESLKRVAALVLMNQWLSAVHQTDPSFLLPQRPYWTASDFSRGFHPSNTLQIQAKVDF